MSLQSDFDVMVLNADDDVGVRSLTIVAVRVAVVSSRRVGRRILRDLAVVGR